VSGGVNANRLENEPQSPGSVQWGINLICLVGEVKHFLREFSEAFLSRLAAAR
jgi:hypothetical protein